MTQVKINIFWHRRDLRLEDNHGLHQALQGDPSVLCLFIFDSNILDPLPAKDARVQFIWQRLQAIKEQLESHYGSSLLIKYGKPEAVWSELVESYKIDTVYTNRDYEPYAQQRDKQIFQYLKEQGITFKGYKDHVIFEKEQILKDDGKPYVVYTPFMKRYKKLLQPARDFQKFEVLKYHQKFYKTEPFDSPTLADMGFESFTFDYPPLELDRERIETYHEKRDIPSIKGTSRLSLHLRFGTLSIRSLASFAYQHNEKFFNELIWRDFYQYVLYHYPHSLNKSFRPEYDDIKWENNEDDFDKWCAGKTGYPLVDAGMRELNQTGFMHNRIRMLTASFLTKHLLIDWRWGEAYFAEKLLDYEAASNVGGWQWAASSGVDAAPYFRIFNPERQLEKFDPDFKYVKKWVKEYGTSAYPSPMVDHKKARERALERYKSSLKKD